MSALPPPRPVGYNADMPDRIIPLESRESFEDDGPASFIEYVAAIILGSVEQVEVDDEAGYDARSLDVGITGAFALGCAVGVEFPNRIEQVLEQVLPGEVAVVLDELRQPFADQVAALRNSGAPLEAEAFTAEIVESLDGADAASLEVAATLIQQTLAYGIMLARLERATAIVLRNAMDRAQREAYEELQELQIPDAGGDGPFETLQGVARCIMDDYEAEIGFRSEA